MASSQAPLRSPLSYVSYQPEWAKAIIRLPPTHARPADCIFLHCCSCNIMGQWNILYPLLHAWARRHPWLAHVAVIDRREKVCHPFLLESLANFAFSDFWVKDVWLWNPSFIGFIYIYESWAVVMASKHVHNATLSSSRISASASHWKSIGRICALIEVPGMIIFKPQTKLRTLMAAPKRINA